MKYWERVLFVIILVLLTIAVTIYVIVTQRQYKNKTFYSWKKHHKPLHAQFLNLFHQTRTILDENGVEWWSHDGTTLGTIRHEGFIPWDDDVDLAIYAGNKTDYDAFYDSIISIFQQDEDLTIEPYWFGFKVRSKTQPFQSSEQALDLFVFFDENDKLVGTLDNQLVFPKEWYYKSQVFPTRIGQFEGHKINVPNDPWAFCGMFFAFRDLAHLDNVNWVERVYSKNFYKEYRVQIPHTVNKLQRAMLDLANYEEQTFALPQKYQSLALKWKK